MIGAVLTVKTYSQSGYIQDDVYYLLTGVNLIQCGSINIRLRSDDMRRADSRIKSLNLIDEKRFCTLSYANNDLLKSSIKTHVHGITLFMFLSHFAVCPTYIFSCSIPKFARFIDVLYNSYLFHILSQTHPK